MADAFTTTGDPYGEFEPAAIAMRDCLDAFEAGGGDPRGYTVAETVRDLRDLRAALGYDSWSAYGLSSSTRVMAELARIDPGGVDAVVLDSFSAPDRNFAATAYEGLELSLNRPGERSGGDFPDPYADLLAAADLLDADPVAVDGHDPVTGQARTFRLTGDDLVTFVHAGLYDVELLPVIPYLLGPSRRRQHRRAEHAGRRRGGRADRQHARAVLGHAVPGRGALPAGRRR